MESEFTPDKILQLGIGFWGSKTLLSAVELELFTLLAKGPLNEAAIGEHLGLHPRSRLDFLDALVALGMLERNGGIYKNTAETDLFLDKAKPTYVGGLLEMANARLYRAWGSLTEALKTGKPQNEAKEEEEDLFEILYADPEKLKGFLQGMTGLSLGSAQAIAKKFPFDRYQSFIDVGSAQGGLAVQVALAHPHLTGGGFDLPPTGPVFEEYVASFGLSDRLKFYPGDFFRDPLPQAEVISMGHILHDWNLEQKKQLIDKAYHALPEGGSFIIFEILIDDERRHNPLGLLSSLNMLVETPGGFDYTGADCCGWLKEAGFRETRVEPLTGVDSMVVGVK